MKRSLAVVLLVAIAAQQASACGLFEFTGTSGVFGQKCGSPVAVDQSELRTKFNIITKINAFTDGKCVTGLRPTYGWDAKNADMLGAKVGTESDLKLAAGEYINKIDVRAGKCVEWIKFTTTKKRTFIVGNGKSVAPLKTVTPNKAKGYLAALKGHELAADKLGSCPSPLVRVEFLWGYDPCDKPATPSPAPVPKPSPTPEPVKPAEVPSPSPVAPVPEPTPSPAPAPVCNQLPIHLFGSYAGISCIRNDAACKPTPATPCPGKVKVWGLLGLKLHALEKLECVDVGVCPVLPSLPPKSLPAFTFPSLTLTKPTISLPPLPDLSQLLVKPDLPKLPPLQIPKPDLTLPTFEKPELPTITLPPKPEFDLSPLADLLTKKPLDLSGLVGQQPAGNARKLSGFDLSKLQLPSFGKKDVTIPGLSLPQIDLPQKTLPTIPALHQPDGAAECFWFLCKPEDKPLPEFSLPSLPEFNITIPILVKPAPEIDIAGLIPKDLPDAITLPYFKFPVIPFELPSINLPDIKIPDLPSLPQDLLPVDWIVNAVQTAYNATTAHVAKVLDVLNPQQQVDINLPGLSFLSGDAATSGLQLPNFHGLLNKN